MVRKLRRYTRPNDIRRAPLGNYFQHAAALQPGTRVIACCRVSEHPQQLAGNLADQEANLRNELAALGAHVVASHCRCWSGADPTWLIQAIDLAREHDADWLVFETIDRAIRSTRFHPYQNPNAVPTVADLDYLAYHTGGLKLATILPPTATPGEIRAFQRRRGQVLKGNNGGRPKRTAPGAKKEIRDRQLNEVLMLHRLGDSYREISRLAELPLMTVYDWVKKYG